MSTIAIVDGARLGTATTVRPIEHLPVALMAPAAQYQKEQAAIVEGQVQATQKYAKNYRHLTDADAVEFINALLTRDQKTHDLRVKWLAKFQAVVPPVTAARAIQVERRLGLVSQVGVSSQIPLVH